MVRICVFSCETTNPTEFAWNLKKNLAFLIENDQVWKSTEFS